MYSGQRSPTVACSLTIILLALLVVPASAGRVPNDNPHHSFTTTNRVSQTDWVGGSGVAGPVAGFGTRFLACESLNYNISGQISPMISASQAHPIIDWVKHTIDLDPGIDGHSGLYPADFDGDGDLDFSGWMSLSCEMRFYRNNMVERGEVDYEPVVTLASPPGSKGKYGQTWAGDINGDGRPDVAVACSTRVFWYENQGDFNFVLHNLGAAHHYCGAVEGGDIDRDGLVDLVVGDQPLEVWYQEADGGFRREYVWKGDCYKILVGDINGDAWPDLLAEDNVFLNDNGTFPSSPTYTGGLPGADGIWIRDFNNDGLTDLLICDQWGWNPGIYWFENLGDGTDYRRHTIYKSWDARSYGDGACAEDIDGDGKADVVGSYSKVGFFHQVTPDSFTLIQVDDIHDSHWIRTGNLDYMPNGTDIDIDFYASASGQRRGDDGEFAWWENPYESGFSLNTELVSSILDAGGSSEWQYLIWNAVRPAGTQLDIYVRTGMTPEECTTSVWQGPITVQTGVQEDSVDLSGYLEEGSYFQYRVVMAGDNTQDPAATPVVYCLEVTYERRVDIGVLEIHQPTGYYEQNDVVTPKADWHNYGTVTTDFTAYCFVSTPSGTRVYSDSKTVAGLGPGETAELEFQPFDVVTTGWWTAVCSTHAVGDDYPANDRHDSYFNVGGEPPQQYGWIEVQQVPPVDRIRPVKDGSWLAADADGLIYCATGNKTTDFHVYTPRGNAGWWLRLKSIPEYEQGRSRPPRKGCCGVSDGGEYIYMVKGNNTYGFWRYDVCCENWESLPGVPPGPKNKKVKYGSDMVFTQKDDTGWVYFLKGYKNEFYKYNTVVGRWDTLPYAPYGGTKPKYKAGSFMVYDNENTIYVHQSKENDGVNHYMFSFDLRADTWNTQPLKGMPLWGKYRDRFKRKRSKGGGCGAWCDGSIWALKGGNTAMYYRYFPSSDLWVEKEPMPEYGQAMKKKRVNKGGDIVYSVRDGIFALKGNKTYEFWHYVRPPDDAYEEMPKVAVNPAVQAEPVSAVTQPSLSVRPDPVAGNVAKLHYSVPATGPASVTMFDAVGRMRVSRRVELDREGQLALHLDGLSKGTYFLTVSGDGYSLKTRMVVSH